LQLRRSVRPINPPAFCNNATRSRLKRLISIPVNSPDVSDGRSNRIIEMSLENVTCAVLT